MNGPITCQQCVFSEGRWLDGFVRAALVCTQDGREAPENICSRFDREPGTQEPEKTSARQNGPS